MYVLLNMVIFQPAILVYRRVYSRTFDQMAGDRKSLYLDPSRVAKWMVEGATKQTLRVQIPSAVCGGVSILIVIEYNHVSQRIQDYPEISWGWDWNP